MNENLKDVMALEITSAWEKLKGLGTQLDMMYAVHSLTDNRVMTEEEKYKELVQLLPVLKSCVDSTFDHVDKVFDYLNN